MSDSELWREMFVIGMRWHTDNNKLRDYCNDLNELNGLIKGAENFADIVLQRLKQRKELG